jgi:hypothetical protein
MLDVKVVFSGLRNPEVENRIKDQGGQVKTAVSNQTTHVIVKDFTKETASMKKAKELGKQVVTQEAFIKQYLETESDKESMARAKIYRFYESEEYKKYNDSGKFKPTLKSAQQHFKTEFNHGDVIEYSYYYRFYVYKKGSTIKFLEDKDNGNKNYDGDQHIPLEITLELDDVVSYFADIYKATRIIMPLSNKDKTIQRIPDFQASFKNKCEFNAYYRVEVDDIIDNREYWVYDFILSIKFKDDTLNFAYRINKPITGKEIINAFKKLHDKKKQHESLQLHFEILANNSTIVRQSLSNSQLEKIIKGTQWKIKEAGIISGPQGERAKINANVGMVFHSNT